MLWFLKKIPPDKIFSRSYMDFEQKYQKDPGMNRVKTKTNTKKTTTQKLSPHWPNRLEKQQPQKICKINVQGGRWCRRLVEQGLQLQYWCREASLNMLSSNGPNPPYLVFNLENKRSEAYGKIENINHIPPCSPPP